VFGGVFWAEGVSRLLGASSSPPELEGWIDLLVCRELIAPRAQSQFSGRREYAFRHALVCDAAYDMLTEADRALGHRLAAAWLEEAGEADAAVLAQHRERGGEGVRAAELYVRAMEQGLETNDVAGVLALAERAIACGASGALLGTIRARQADAYACHGDYKEMGRHALDAVALLPAGSPMWFCTASELTWWVDMHDSALRAKLVEEIARQGAALRETSDEALAAVAMAAYNLLQSAGMEAVKPLFDHLEGAEGRPLFEAHRSAALGGRLALDGDLVGASAAIRAAAEQLERAGEARRAIHYRFDVARIDITRGALVEAEENLERLSAHAMRTGTTYLAGSVKFYALLLLQRRGRLDEALALGASLLEDALGRRDRMKEAASRGVLADLLLRRGDLGAADREAIQAVEASAATFPMLRLRALVALAEVRLARGLPEEARPPIEEAMRLLEPLTFNQLVYEAHARLVHAEVLHADGSLPEARKVIAALRDLLLLRAGKMADPQDRRRYLDVPEHARALQYAAEWLGDAGAPAA
jgi:hypothetical protein